MIFAFAVRLFGENTFINHRLNPSNELAVRRQASVGHDALQIKRVH